MTVELKIQKIGDSLGIILPTALLAHLKATEGDSLLLTEAGADMLHLVSAKSEVAKQMAVFADISRRYENTLRELAK